MEAKHDEIPRLGRRKIRQPIDSEDTGKFISPEAMRIKQGLIMPGLIKAASPAMVLDSTASTAISLANAFGQPPAFPCPLTVTSVSADSISIREIKDIEGDSMLTFESGIIDCESNNLNDVGVIGCSDISCGNIVANSIGFGSDLRVSALSSYYSTNGTFSSLSGPFTGATGTFSFTKVGPIHVLSITGFTGTTNTITVGPNQQLLSLTPDLTPYFTTNNPPAFIQVQTAATQQGIGVAETFLGTSQVVIANGYDNEQWQWASETANQGWSSFSLSWSA